MSFYLDDADNECRWIQYFRGLVLDHVARITARYVIPALLTMTVEFNNNFERGNRTLSTSAVFDQIQNYVSVSELQRDLLDLKNSEIQVKDALYFSSALEKFLSLSWVAEACQKNYRFRQMVLDKR